jgi:hypothetical protein
MMEKIVHTAKHTVKARVLMPSAMVRSRLPVIGIACIAIARTPVDGGRFRRGRGRRG